MFSDSSSSVFSLFPTSTVSSNAFSLFGQNPRDKFDMYDEFGRAISGGSPASNASSISSRRSSFLSTSTLSSDSDRASISSQETLVGSCAEEEKKTKTSSGSFLADFDLTECWKRFFGGM